MNKSDLVNEVAKALKTKKDAQAAVDSVFAVITEALKKQAAADEKRTKIVKPALSLIKAVSRVALLCPFSRRLMAAVVSGIDISSAISRVKLAYFAGIYS